MYETMIAFIKKTVMQVVLQVVTLVTGMSSRWDIFRFPAVILVFKVN